MGFAVYQETQSVSCGSVVVEIHQSDQTQAGKLPLGKFEPRTLPRTPHTVYSLI